MNTVELIGSAYEPAANSAPGPGYRAPWGERVWREDLADNARSATARSFLIQLVVREIQFTERSNTWLRMLAEADEPVRGWAHACRQLADQTRSLRGELAVLLHRLVARRNRLNPRCRVDVIALLAQPLSEVMVEQLELHEVTVAGSTPWLELAALRPIEQMLAGMVPLAIDVAGAGHSDLQEAALLFGGRAARAGVLGSLLANSIAADPRRSEQVHAAEEQAIASFTKVLIECAQIGRELDSWRHGFVR